MCIRKNIGGVIKRQEKKKAAKKSIGGGKGENCYERDA